MAASAEPRLRAPLWPRLAATPIAIALVLVGIWLAGGVLTDDFRASMALTALWFALVVAGGTLALSTLRDTTVNERVAAGPALLGGAFAAGAHETTGTARLVSAQGGTVLTLTDFRTVAGPDLFVYAVASGGPTRSTGACGSPSSRATSATSSTRSPRGSSSSPGPRS